MNELQKKILIMTIEMAAGLALIYAYVLHGSLLILLCGGAFFFLAAVTAGNFFPTQEDDDEEDDM